MRRLTPPRHSEFRVLCLVAQRVEGRLFAEFGSNSEVVSLAGGMCAERCVVGKLLLSSGGRTLVVGIERIVIVSDAPHCVLPGCQCREILVEHVPTGVPYVCAWQPAGGGRLELRTLTMEALYPHPSVYRWVPRREVSGFAERLSRRCEKPASEDAKRLLEATLAAARGLESTVHPVHYAAGALFASGEVRTCAAALIVEFPCCIDPVARLSTWIEEHARRQDPPELLLVCDQWGVLHAPFAIGRSYLLEHGCGGVATLVHDGGSGKVLELPCEELGGSGEGVSAIECLC